MGKRGAARLAISSPGHASDFMIYEHVRAEKENVSDFSVVAPSGGLAGSRVLQRTQEQQGINCSSK